jgi:hypothetical protein
MIYSEGKALAIEARAGAELFERYGRTSPEGRPNGLAQRTAARANRTPLLLSRNLAKCTAYQQRQSRCPLEPVLGRLFLKQLNCEDSFSLSPEVFLQSHQNLLHAGTKSRPRNMSFYR